MGLRYDINQKQLKAENAFRIDHFTLGPRNDSTNATSLPVKLAVALLKDRNGQIALDVPLSGRTDDPEFKIAPLVFKVVLNLIMKAATSPFSLLGALVGGGEELGFVEFLPGQADISGSEAEKLDKLVKALYERPALSLEIAGLFDPEQDRAALARVNLEQHLNRLHLRELADAGKAVPAPADVKIEPPHRERLLRQFFADLGTNRTLVLQLAAAVADTNTPTAAPSAPLAARTTQVSAAKAAKKPLSIKPSGLEEKGSSALLRPLPGRPVPAAQPAPGKASAATEARPLPLDEIETRLLAAIEVPENQRRDLMQRRAQAVQALLLQSGKVAADRLFIATAQALTPSASGQCRVNLTLN